MPRKKQPLPQTYAEYAGFFTAEMRQRAIDAGCRDLREVHAWLYRHYGRDQNRSFPPPCRRPDERS